MNINKFISNVTGGNGLASPARYQVSFISPIGLDEGISIMCNVASMPNRGITTVENRHYNTPFKLPYATLYNEITFTFVNTRGLKEREYFDKWQNLVIEPSTGLIGFYKEFTGTIIIDHLDKQGDPDYSIEIIEAYPIDITDVSLGYSMSNDLLTTNISFLYKYWEQL